MTSPEYDLSEKPAIELLKLLDYDYYDASTSADERESINDVLIQSRVQEAIKRLNPWLQEQQIAQAIREVNITSYDSLMDANELFWKKALCQDEHTTQLEDPTNNKRKRDVQYFDFSNPDNNDWLVVNQMKYKGKHMNSIPDLVVYVNGFPLAVMECKSPTATTAIDQALSDMMYYQSNSEKLFIYNFICAGMCKWKAKYGAIQASTQFYSSYRVKDDSKIQAFLGREVTEQDIMLYSLFKKENFLDIFRHFTLFEISDGEKIKKLPRYQQIRATNNTIDALKAVHGGVVWATQGSGKSLTMGYVTRKLQAEEFGFNNPTIIVMTDRKDLDRQITNTFNNIGLKNVNQASSVAHLKKLLQNDYGQIITTTIQKFQETDDDGNIIRTRKEKQADGKVVVIKEVVDEEGSIVSSEWMHEASEEDINNPLTVEELSQKENVYVMIDEAHRSQYGLLASFMRQALPHAKFVAFTGTPLSKEDKSTLGTFYGGDYLDVYTIKEAVEDGATLPLLYEQGLPEYFIDKDGLEKSFQEQFGHESKAKQDLLQKQGTKHLTHAEGRLEAIAEHLLNHYQARVYPDGMKAMLVCDNRATAIAYKKIFNRLQEEKRHQFNTCLVMSFSPKKDPEEYFALATPVDEVKDTVENYKLPFGDVEDKEKSGKLKFNNDAILIVSDMLLTGYDAPIAGVLYLDKNLKEHTLLQALARVNRTKKGKKAGLIVDYYGITENLINALEIFSGDLTREDVVADFESEFPKLEQRHVQLVQLFKSIKIDRNYEQPTFVDKAVRMLESLDKRDQFKDLLKKFNESVSIITPHPMATKYKADIGLFNQIKLQARNMYPDDDTLKVSKEESEKLKSLIDEHLTATGVKNLLEEPVSIIDRKKFEEEMDQSISDESKAKLMVNRTKHTIKVGESQNPDFYKPLAERLQELIELNEADRISQLDLFKSIQEEIIDKIENQSKEAQSLGFTEQEFAVYNTVLSKLDGQAAEVTRKLFDAIQDELLIVGWMDKFAVLKEIEKKLRKELRGQLEREELKELVPHLVDVIKKNA